jgi:2-desacetyl-2-hydroxyethyl bacteriochlorophyllide A dehydrogenase
VKAHGLSFVAPRRVEITDVDLPEMGDGQTLVRTTYSGISAGTELLAYRGEIDPDLPLDDAIGSLGGTFTFPFRYGYSCVGRVERSNSGLAAGALVFAYHPHQDRFVASGSDLVVVDGVEPRLATLFPLGETALQVCLDAGPVAHERVVVLGLGAVGLLTALLLQRAGADVLGGEPRASRREMAAALGVRAVTVEELPGEVGRDGVPLVVEVSGQPAALTGALDLLAHEGVALVASWYGTRPVPLALGGRFHRRRLTIRSTQVSSIPSALSARWTRERRRVAVRRLLDELPLDALWLREFPFASASQAFEAVDSGADGFVHAALRYE